MFVIAITSSSKLFENMGLLNSRHTHRHDHALFVFITHVVVLMILILVYSMWITLLQHHSRHYIEMKFILWSSLYYNMFIVDITPSSKLFKNVGLLTYDPPPYLWLESLSSSFHFISHHKIHLYRHLSSTSSSWSSLSSSLWWTSSSTFD